jgi:hypothetical protein
MVMQWMGRQGMGAAGMLCLLLGTGAIAADAPAEKGAAVSSTMTGTAERPAADQRAEWQKRVADARQQLAEAEARKARLEQKRNALKYEWAAPGASRTNEMIDAELGRTNAELLEAQQDIDEATNLLEVVIPDEARKAGVPPGWLRE